MLRESCDWLSLAADGSLSALLGRLGIHDKRGRDDVQSPDPDYPAKLDRVAQIVAAVPASAGRLVALYLDELTYYRQPTLARASAAAGADQPLARRSYQANTAPRVIGALNGIDARVSYRQASRLGIRELGAFHQQLRADYPAAERLFLIEDNGPIHCHPDVLVALEAQENPDPLYRPRHWSLDPSPQAVQQWGHLHLPLQWVPLPTQASWTNPIEKLWRWLKQAVLHRHQSAGNLEQLRQAVCRFLDRFAYGSHDLRRYVGLLVPI